MSIKIEVMYVVSVLYPKERGLVSLSCLLAGNAVTASLGSVSKQVLVFQCVMIV